MFYTTSYNTVSKYFLATSVPNTMKVTAIQNLIDCTTIKYNFI